MCLDGLQSTQCHRRLHSERSTQPARRRSSRSFELLSGPENCPSPPSTVKAQGLRLFGGKCTDRISVSVWWTPPIVASLGRPAPTHAVHALQIGRIKMLPAIKLLGRRQDELQSAQSHPPRAGLSKIHPRNLEAGSPAHRPNAMPCFHLPGSGSTSRSKRLLAPSDQQLLDMHRHWAKLQRIGSVLPACSPV